MTCQVHAGSPRLAGSGLLEAASCADVEDELPADQLVVVVGHLDVAHARCHPDVALGTVLDRLPRVTADFDARFAFGVDETLVLTADDFRVSRVSSFRVGHGCER